MITALQPIIHNVPVKYKCDVCGVIFDGTIHVFDFQEMIHIDHCCGYGTIYKDGTTLKLDICQHCFRKILGKYTRSEDD